MTERHPHELALACAGRIRATLQERGEAYLQGDDEVILAHEDVAVVLEEFRRMRRALVNVFAWCETAADKPGVTMGPGVREHALNSIRADVQAAIAHPELVDPDAAGDEASA